MISTVAVREARAETLLHRCCTTAGSDGLRSSGDLVSSAIKVVALARKIIWVELNSGIRRAIAIDATQELSEKLLTVSWSILQIRKISTIASTHQVGTRRYKIYEAFVITGTIGVHVGRINNAAFRTITLAIGATGRVIQATGPLQIDTHLSGGVASGNIGTVVAAEAWRVGGLRLCWIKTIACFRVAVLIDWACIATAEASRSKCWY